MSTILNMPEQAMGSEYALIYMNMSNYARILNITCRNIPECGKICLILSSLVNIAEYD